MLSDAHPRRLGPAAQAHPWLQQGSPRLSLDFNANYLAIDAHPTAVAHREAVQARAQRPAL